MIKVLLLSKACLVGAYQTKLAEIGKHDDIALTAVVPPSWNDPAGTIRLERLPAHNYQLLVDPIRFNGRFHLYYFPNLQQRLCQLQPDILHIDEEPYNLATWLALRQAQRHQAKTVFFSWQNIQRHYPPPFSLLEKQVLAQADYAIVGNRDSAAVWRQKGYQKPLQIIPQFGVDPILFQPAKQREPEPDFIIGAANRRLVPEKGVDLLLQAAARLPGSWRLHIAGEGPAKLQLQRLAQRLHIAERVFFDGPISSQQMPGYLQSLDVLVLASRTLPNWKEQFGRVLIEAMACGVPVIGAESGEIPHVVAAAGLTFPEENVDALHNHLINLMQSEKLRSELAENGRNHVLAHYTQAQIAQKTVAVYRDMVRE